MAEAPLDPLANLNEEELRELIRSLAAEHPDIAFAIEAAHGTPPHSPSALTELRVAIEEDLTPHKRFYDYSQANQYAYDAGPTVDMVCALAEQASPEVLPVIERAITLTTRTLLRSDDSSGMQGDQVHELLEAHAAAVCNSTPRLSAKEQKRLVNWIIKYRYDGKQDFFDPDIVAYAPGLDRPAIDHYRSEIEGQDLGEYGRYPIRRLAVLDRDPRAIVAAHKVPHNAFMASALVDDLREAGLRDEAIHFAKLGLSLSVAERAPELVDYLVEVAIEDGLPEEALKLRRDWHEQHASWESFHRLKNTAAKLGAWGEEQSAAESLLSAQRPKMFLRYLLDENRDDEAWHFALAQGDGPDGSEQWITLCERRGRTHPAEALPVYRSVITDVLAYADKRNYRLAAELLREMRQVAVAARGNAPEDFREYLAATIEQNRRRPRCMEAFARARLM